MQMKLIEITSPESVNEAMTFFMPKVSEDKY